MLSIVRHYLNRYLYHRSHRMFPALEVPPSSVAACGQDFFVANLLQHKRNGIFFDIGTNDGISISNSPYFERELGWKGVAVEPVPTVFEQLQSNRNCHLPNACISPKAGLARMVEIEGAPNMHSSLESNHRGLTARRIRKNALRHQVKPKLIEVECCTFAEECDRFGYKRIDFLSLDTEGGELEILMSIPFERIDISLISVENNYYTDAIERFLKVKGYLLLGTFKVDEIYLFIGEGGEEADDVDKAAIGPGRRD